ncbi:unnamed protein product, partial [Ectocarpus sp. 4 AP-2014]
LSPVILQAEEIPRPHHDERVCASFVRPFVVLSRTGGSVPPGRYRSTNVACCTWKQTAACAASCVAVSSPPAAPSRDRKVFLQLRGGREKGPPSQLRRDRGSGHRCCAGGAQERREGHGSR